MNTYVKILNKILANGIQQDIKKIRSSEFIPWAQGWFHMCKLINVIHHSDQGIKNHITLSLDAEK